MPAIQWDHPRRNRTNEDAGYFAPLEGVKVSRIFRITRIGAAEATVRLVPGVLGSPESIGEETFSDTTSGGLEPPLYTRPADFEGQQVPEVLRSGNHAAIAAWRREQSDEQTRRRRPDLVRLRAVPGGNK